MSHSIKRNNKYCADDLCEFNKSIEEHREHLKEKRIRAALKAKNVNVLHKLTEEEY